MTTYELLSAFFAGGTLVAVIVAAAIYNGQLRQMTKATDAAFKAAEAAEKAANVAAESNVKSAERFEIDERAYVIVTGTGWEPLAPSAMVPFTVTAYWTNTGRTPAIEFRAAAYIDVLESEPTDYARWQAEARAGNQSGTIGASKDARNIKPITLTVDQVASIQGGQRKLFIYGTCLYKDIFNKEHKSRFSFYWNPIARFFDTSTTGNYME